MGPTSEALAVLRPPRGWTPMNFRWCTGCRLFTECGLCPVCLDRLGDQGAPHAANSFRGELDFATELAYAGSRGACDHCTLVAPFHSSSQCPGIAISSPTAGAIQTEHPTSAPASALPAGPAHHQEAP